MDSLIFSINAVMPIVILVVIGYFLKKINFIGADFAKVANKLVFHLFLPAMLFLNVYEINDIGSVDFGYVLYAAAVLIFVFLIALPLVIAVAKEPSRRGVVLQASFRSNYALVGIPLANSLFGAEGVAVATLLSAVYIPLLNILAVISLSVFGGKGRASIKKIFLDILKNPLIESIAAGLFALCVRAVFVKYGVTFRLGDIAPLFTALKYLSGVATPLALLVLGAQFEFSAISSLKKEIIFGTAMRTVVTPCIGIGIAYLVFGKYFSGAHFAAFVAAFATPVAVSSVPMAQEMGGDTALAGQMVIWSTLVSSITIFAASFILKTLGVF